MVLLQLQFLLPVSHVGDGFCFSAVALWSSGYTWHDQQRISQLLLLCICALLAVLVPQAHLPRSALLLLAGLLLLGLLSSVLADYPLWALKVESLWWVSSAGSDCRRIERTSRLAKRDTLDDGVCRLYSCVPVSCGLRGGFYLRHADAKCRYAV